MENNQTNTSEQTLETSQPVQQIQQVQSEPVSKVQTPVEEPIPVKIKKKFSLLPIFIFLIVILLITGGVYAGMQLEKEKVKIWIEPPLTEASPQPTEIPNEIPKYNGGLVACTQEAIVCPDGSYVGRVGPNCEFAPCPDSGSDEISDWKTYKNNEYGFEFKYPKEVELEENIDGDIRLVIIGLTQKKQNFMMDFHWYLKNLFIQISL